MTMILDDPTDLDKLGESPDMLGLRRQVASQLRVARLEAVKPAQQPATPDDTEDVWPRDASPELLAALGPYVSKLTPDGEHLVWLKGKSITVTMSDINEYDTVLAAPVIWQRVYGPLPLGAHIENGCGRARCFRPDHLKCVGAPPHLTGTKTEYVVELTIRRMFTASSYAEAEELALLVPGVDTIHSIQKVKP